MTRLSNVSTAFIVVLFVGLYASELWAESQVVSTKIERERLKYIQSLKVSTRGPFKRIRWFCHDGSVLPPNPYACSSRGGGVQHGELRDQVLALRKDGFQIANVLASTDPQALLENPHHLRHLILEKHLTEYDDGWIFRQAQYYRGALQAEDESAAALKIIDTLVAQPNWDIYGLPLAYQTVRWLPLGALADSAHIDRIRALAAQLHDKDEGFAQLRNKIHGAPDREDAFRVRSYATERGRAALANDYANLAQLIEELNSDSQFRKQLLSIGRQVSNQALATALTSSSDRYQAHKDLFVLLTQTSNTMAKIRSMLPTLSTRDRRQAIFATVLLENRLFASLQPIEIQQTTRRSLIQALYYLAQATYAVGLLSDREWQQFSQSHRLLGPDRPNIGGYRATLRALARVPIWAQQRLTFEFQPAIEKLAQIEPLAREFIPNVMRSSLLLKYSQILNVLAEDASRKVGINHYFLDRTVTNGLRSLNPGLAEGVLITLEDYADDANPHIPKILLVPETLADLPPVAGILTENEGNQLSHVQLLARNLGIPNVVISPELLEEVRNKKGHAVRLASSPGGVVRLEKIDPAIFHAAFTSKSPDSNQQINVDLGKLDLVSRSPMPLQSLRASDSGVSVGPKAAQLGELNARYSDQVSQALTIPFGSFRGVLALPITQGSPMSAFEWLSSRYRHWSSIDEGGQKRNYRNETLRRIRNWFMEVELDPSFVRELRVSMAAVFGPEGSYGVFVRSDTNVEDLPGFTGAGLNLTVPNVVGFDEILHAVRRVWASPFSERAFGWRQALMKHPEHLYVSVLLHKSVNSEKSGVLVTANIETGDRSEYTVVVNEGVGGGVEGQSAEMLIINPGNRQNELYRSATSPTKRVLSGHGGSEMVRAEGPNQLLIDSDMVALNDLVNDVNQWFAVDGQRLVADIEFGFHKGRLILFQIRPFVENRTARGNSELMALDRPLQQRVGITIDTSQLPRAEE